MSVLLHFVVLQLVPVAPLAISIDGFEKIFAAPHLTLKVTNLEISKEKKYLLKICLIYINSFSKIDGFVEPSSQIDGFGRTCATQCTEERRHAYIRKIAKFDFDGPKSKF